LAASLKPGDSLILRDRSSRDDAALKLFKKTLQHSALEGNLNRLPFEFPRGESWPSYSDRVHNSASASLSQTASVHTSAAAGQCRCHSVSPSHVTARAWPARRAPLAAGATAATAHPESTEGPPAAPAPRARAGLPSAATRRTPRLRVGARPLNEARPAGRGLGAASPPSHACHAYQTCHQLEVAAGFGPCPWGWSESLPPGHWHSQPEAEAEAPSPRSLPLRTDDSDGTQL
jgi:hypothetical protein